MSPMASPCSAAQASTENRPLTSVAVVTAAAAPSASASRSARALAPPIWPDSRGITNRARSSAATTAGSVRLSRTWGAMARTAMPQELMKISASISRNRGAVKSARGGAMASRPSSASRSGANSRHPSPASARAARTRRAVRSPCRLKANTAALTAPSPSGIRW